MARVLILDGIDESAREICEAAGHEVTRQGPLAGDELISALQEVEAVLVRSATKIRTETLKACPNLKAIGRAGAGVDNIDVDFAVGQGVRVVNAPGTNSNAVAELAIGHMLTLARKLNRADAGTRAGEWPKKACSGTELRGKVIGVIGPGQIGRRVLELGVAFGMTPVYNDCVSDHSHLPSHWVSLATEELIGRADVISLHIPETEQSRHMFNDRLLGWCKPGSWLINTARGGLIDTEALVRALQDPKAPLAGAALDVFEDEPLAADHPLCQLDNVVLTPHIGASTSEAQLAAGRVAAEQVCEVLKSGSATFMVGAR